MIIRSAVSAGANASISQRPCCLWLPIGFVLHRKPSTLSACLGGGGLNCTIGSPGGCVSNEDISQRTKRPTSDRVLSEGYVHLYRVQSPARVKQLQLLAPDFRRYYKCRYKSIQHFVASIPHLLCETSSLSLNREMPRHPAHGPGPSSSLAYLSVIEMII